MFCVEFGAVVSQETVEQLSSDTVETAQDPTAVPILHKVEQRGIIWNLEVQCRMGQDDLSA